MKYIYKSIAIFLLSAIGTMSVFAQDKPMNMQQSKSSGQAMNKGMGMEMSEEMKDKQARDKQKYILKINQLSDQIEDEKNPKKKQALMDQQLQLIKDHQEKKRAIANLTERNVNHSAYYWGTLAYTDVGKANVCSLDI
jgi:predicted outer membrane protein